jgi:hypothetical protein
MMAALAVQSLSTLADAPRRTLQTAKLALSLRWLSLATLPTHCRSYHLDKDDKLTRLITFVFVSYINWSKPSYNPIINNTQRDPSTAWQTPDGEWRIISTQNMCCEQLLYEAIA